MSQSTLLKDVATWDERKCREEVDEALPHLIGDLSNGVSIDTRVGILEVLSFSFLPIISVSQLQNKLFAQVLPNVSQLFDECVAKVTFYLNDSTQNITEAGLIPQLKVLMQIVDSLVIFVSHVSKSPDVKFEYVESLPPSAVHVIKRSFEHCKMSNTLYGDLFQSVSEHLMALFKKSHQLQKSLMTLMDVFTITSNTPADCIKSFVKVCDTFHDICCIISKMDSALMVATWKFLVKLITKHKEYVQHELDVSVFVSSLCRHIQDGFGTCLDQAPRSSPSAEFSGDEKAFQRNLKICHLSAKMLVHMLKEYGQLAMLKPKTLYQMLLMFHSKSPPSLQAPELTTESREAFKNSLLICTEPIIQLICSERLFCELVTSQDNDITSEHEFAQCILLVGIMRQLPTLNDDTQAMWLVPVQHSRPTVNIIEVIFESASQCFSELTLPVLLPGVRSGGVPDVSFHQYLVTHISAYIASIQAKHFHLVEGTLLKWCLSTFSHVSLIAIDVWCFIARYSTAELCNKHVRCLVQILSRVSGCYNSLQHMQLSNLVSRLIAFMTEEHQTQLFADFPPSQHPSIWSCLPLTSFPEPMQQAVYDDIISFSNEVFSQWHSQPQTMSNIYNLSCHVAVLSNIYQQYENSTFKQQHLSILQNVEQVWFNLNIECFKDHVLLILLIQLSSCLVDQFNSKSQIKVLDQLKQCLRVGVRSDTRLAIIEFLGKMGKLTFSNENHVDDTTVDDVTCRIASLFSCLLADTCFVVYQQALVVFNQFAEETVYESIVTDSLSDDVTQAAVIKFLQQIPYSYTDDRQAEILGLRNQKEIISKKQTNSNSNDDAKVTLTENTVEPVAKRSKGEHYDKLNTVVTQLKECLDQVKALKPVVGDLPEWFKENVNDIGTQLTDICR